MRFLLPVLVSNPGILVRLGRGDWLPKSPDVDVDKLHFKGLKFSFTAFCLGRSLDKHLRGGPEGVSFSSKQLVAADRAFVRTVIYWDISGARMGVGIVEWR